MTDLNTSGVTMQPMPKNLTSALALTNAAQITAGVIKGLAGRSIADSINGSPVMQQQLAQMAIARMIKQLQARNDAARSMRLAGYNR